MRRARGRAAGCSEHLGEPDLRVVDCRFTLGEPGAGRRAWLAGHVPGAAFLDLDADLAGEPGERGRHPLPDPEAFEARRAPRWDRRRLARRGLRRGGRGRRGPALVAAAPPRPRGGGRAGRRPGRLARRRRAAARRRGDRGARRLRGPPRARATRADADEAAAAPVLLDARAPERYRGESEPIDPVAGHIPGAVNLPSSELAPGGRFLDPGELRARLERAGAAPGREVVAYCGSGVTACTIVLAAELAGLGPARLYPGSWSEWSRRRTARRAFRRRLKRAPIPADTGTIFSRPDHIRLPGEPVPRRGSMPRTRVLSGRLRGDARLVARRSAPYSPAARPRPWTAPSSPTRPRTPRRSGASASRAGRGRGCCCRSAATGASRPPCSPTSSIPRWSSARSRACARPGSRSARSRAWAAVTCQGPAASRHRCVFNFTAPSVPLLDITNSGTGGAIAAATTTSRLHGATRSSAYNYGTDGYALWAELANANNPNGGDLRAHGRRRAGDRRGGEQRAPARPTPSSPARRAPTPTPTRASSRAT